MQLTDQILQTDVPQLLKLTEVTSRTKLCRATLYTYVQAGRFPRPIRLGKHSRWIESEVRAFIDGLADARPTMEAQSK